MRKSKILKKGMSSVAKTIGDATAGNFYRPDLKRAAIAKAYTLKQAAKRKSAGVSKGKGPRAKGAWKK